jgi:hypothetical protein
LVIPAIATANGAEASAKADGESAGKDSAVVDIEAGTLTGLKTTVAVRNKSDRHGAKQRWINQQAQRKG